MALTANALNDYAEFATVPSLLDGATALTVLVTYIGASTTAGRYFISRRRGGSNCFFLGTTGSPILLQLAAENSSGQIKYGTTTGESPTVTSGTHRIGARWRASDNDIGLYVNGTSLPVSLAGTNIAALRTDANAKIRVASYTVNNAAFGDYAEAAIFTRYLADWEMRAYGLGLSPRFLGASGRVVYAPLVNTSHLIEEWTRNPITLNSITTAAHPSMLRPAAPFVFPVSPLSTIELSATDTFAIQLVEAGFATQLGVDRGSVIVATVASLTAARTAGVLMPSRTAGSLIPSRTVQVL